MYERAVEIIGVTQALLPEKYRWFSNWAMHQEAEKTLRNRLMKIVTMSHSNAANQWI